MEGVCKRGLGSYIVVRYAKVRVPSVVDHHAKSYVEAQHIEFKDQDWHSWIWPSGQDFQDGCVDRFGSMRLEQRPSSGRCVLADDHRHVWVLRDVCGYLFCCRWLNGNLL